MCLAFDVFENTEAFRAGMMSFCGSCSSTNLSAISWTLNSVTQSYIRTNWTGSRDSQCEGEMADSTWFLFKTTLWGSEVTEEFLKNFQRDLRMPIILRKGAEKTNSLLNWNSNADSGLRDGKNLHLYLTGCLVPCKSYVIFKGESNIYISFALYTTLCNFTIWFYE